MLTEAAEYPLPTEETCMALNVAISKQTVMLNLFTLRELKIRAAKEGKNQGQVLTEAVEFYLAHLNDLENGDKKQTPTGKEDVRVAKIKAGDRVYHVRKGDPIATEGYGTVLEIGGTRATLLWEHNRKQGSVERRDLLTEIEAADASL
jgi:hypothetical protein